jgi:hypothetical protein
MQLLSISRSAAAATAAAQSHGQGMAVPIMIRLRPRHFLSQVVVRSVCLDISAAPVVTLMRH